VDNKKTPDFALRNQLLLASLAVCAWTVAHAQSPETIGVILPMTGDFARYGEKVREGLESKKIDSVKFVLKKEPGTRIEEN
jgi:hypothetical protein